MSLIRKHGAVLQAWACLDLVTIFGTHYHDGTFYKIKFAFEIYLSLCSVDVIINIINGKNTFEFLIVIHGRL